MKKLLITVFIVTVIANDFLQQRLLQNKKKIGDHYLKIPILNGQPRLDVDGNVMNIHRGNTIYKEGVYYTYGINYGSCQEPEGTDGCKDKKVGACGFQLNHTVNLYKSGSLNDQQNLGTVFEFVKSGIKGILKQANVLLNPNTQEYVLWFSYQDINMTQTQYGVAKSKSAEGPFQVITKRVTSLAYQNLGDFSLFQEDNGTAYIIYAGDSCFQGTGRMSVERLSDNYYYTLGQSFSSGQFGDWNQGAPIMFKQGDTYTALFSKQCCFCFKSEPPRQFISNSPLGPYTKGELVYNIDTGITSQQSNVFKARTYFGDLLIMIGDMWQSSPDGQKSHDLTYWQEFSSYDNGTIRQMNYQPGFQVLVAIPYYQ